MRRLERPPPPPCLATDTGERAQRHRERYASCRYPGGAWKALWNDLDKDETGTSAPRRALLAMSAGECAYCGRCVGDPDLQVDHILPKEDFPLLAYAWENLLPACGTCNRRKLAFVPVSLEGKRVVEACLQATTPHDLVFDKARLFGEVARDDRLVDPSFDDPGEHLDLVMDVPTYRPKTPAGRLTWARFFRHREVAERLCRVRDLARAVVEDECSPELVDLMTAAGNMAYPSLFRRFVDHFRAAGRGGLLPAESRVPEPETEPRT